MSRRGHGEGGVYRETRTRTTNDGTTVATTFWVVTVEDERDPATGQRRQVKLRAKTKAARSRRSRSIASGWTPEYGSSPG